MPGVKISALTTASALDGTEIAPVVQGVTTKRTTLQVIADWIVKTSTSFAQSGTGAVSRTMQAKAREWVSVEDFGAVGDGTTDDTTAFTAALTASNCVVLGAKTYVVSQVTIAANKKVVTQGFKTIIQQKNTAGRTNQPIFTVTGGNVEIGTFAAIGNITTDADEWNHVIYINPSAQSSGIILGVIKGTNIRGDVVAMDATSANQIRDVKIAGILGSNIYRSGLSILCGDGVEVGFVDVPSAGYRVVDIEPNGASSGSCDNIKIGYIKGGKFQISGTAANIVGNVQVDAIDADTAYMSNSTPGYGTYATDIACNVHHFKNLSIGSLSAKSFSYANIYCAAGNLGGNVSIGRYFSSGCACGSPGGAEVVVDGCTQLKIDYAITTLPGITKFWLSGNPTLMYVSNVTGSAGRAIEFASRGSRFMNWTWDATGVTATQMFQTDNCVFEGFTITAGTKFLDDTSTGCTLINSTIGSTTFAAAGNDHVVIQSTVETVAIKLGIWDNDYRDNMRIGAYRMWVDADGKMLRKSTDPASDTDGTSVGLGSTQATIGANGAASALTANPVGYAKVRIAGTQYIVPYYNP